MLFFKKDIAASHILKGMTDYHTHLLPGVDDGVKSESEACEILDYLELQGVERVVLTPHVMEDYPLNQTDFLKDCFRLLCNVYQGKIELILGGEYMLDFSFEKQLANDNLLTLPGDNLLVETSCIHAPINYQSMLQKIQSYGYHVVLAHPERYVYLNSVDYQMLKERNVKFQLNILSLVGAYGRVAQIKSQELLKKGMYDFIGSDLHHLQSFEKWTHKRELSTATIDKLKQLKSVCRNYGY